MRALAVATFGSIGRKVELAAFAGQLKELHAEPSLRMAEWTASTPYSTNRIAALHRFARDPLFLTWAPRFAANAAAPPVPDAREAVYAGFWRRTWAFLIDVAVIQAIVPAAAAVQQRVFSLKELVGFNGPHITVGGNPLLWAVFGVYAIVLVALVGQTVGMMICDLRVITAGGNPRVGFGRAVGRYLSLVAGLIAVVGWLSLFRRVQPYEKWSRTRLVSGSAAIR